MNKVTSILFFIFYFSLFSFSTDSTSGSEKIENNSNSANSEQVKINKEIVEKTLKYILDCIIDDTNKLKFNNYEKLLIFKTQNHKLQKFEDELKINFINTYNSFTSILINVSKESNNYNEFINKVHNLNKPIFDKYFKHFSETKKQDTQFSNINNSKIKNKELPYKEILITMLLISNLYFALKKDKRKKIKHKKNEEENIFLRVPNNDEISNLKNELEDKKRECEYLNSELKKIKKNKEFNILNNENLIDNNLVKEITKTSEETVDTNLVKPTTKIYYFLAPISDNTFNDAHKKNELEYGNSMFKFTVTDKDTRANFEFCGDKNVINYVMRFPDESIDRVCEYLNSKSEFKLGLITESPGVAELKGDKWIVKQPAKIKFI